MIKIILDFLGFDKSLFSIKKHQKIVKNFVSQSLRGGEKIKMLSLITKINFF
jgi:hypothetical protein